MKINNAESQLALQDRSELSDYARSGYDRCHMSPNADFANRTAQAPIKPMCSASGIWKLRIEWIG